MSTNTQGFGENKVESSLKKMVETFRRLKHLDTILLENPNNTCTKVFVFMSD